MSGSLRFLLVIVAVRHSAASLVNIECLSNCIINSKTSTVNGEVDNDIAVKYTIKSSFDIVSLQYDGKPLVVATNAIFLTFPSPFEFDFGKRKLAKEDGTFSFEMTLKKVNIDTQDKKDISFNLAYDGDQMLTMTHTTIVHDGPYFLGSWQSSDTLEEGTSKEISFIVYGKPRPSVTAHIGETQLMVNSSFLRDLTYEYKTNVIAERKNCGKNVTVKAIGFKEPSLTSEFTVLFDPSPPDQLYAYLSKENCLTISWTGVESGNCPVMYTLRYNGTKELANKTRSTFYEQCDSQSFDKNTYVSVQAEINGRVSAFSNRVQVLLTKPPKKGERRDRDYGRWDFYFLVTLSIIVLIGIIVCILILLANRKQKECSSESLDLKNYQDDIQSTSSIENDVQKDKWLVLDVSDEQGGGDDQIIMAKVLKEM